ncbi:FMN-binding negative transcriptional regulator [Streptomyces sp. NPDC001985]|uniref:FMN-binding negative transcriptional regulator n=1 Tax=Streptomyces sp. NPDC001985 TaxID=3154406 RepID=UPI00332279FB
MYVPSLYRTEDRTWPVRILEENPLALLSTSRASAAPYATHVPVIIPRDSRAELLAGQDPRGAVLLGHMNRANPHWAALSSGSPAQLVFQGPGAYVSPAVYDTDPAAPTWDFAAVHVHGTLRLIDDDTETLEVVTATAAELEGRFGGGWCAHASAAYFEELLPGVGAFAFRVTRMDTMLKLSQEKSPGVRSAVTEWFRAGGGRGAEMARLMKDFYQDGAPRGEGPAEPPTDP